MEREPEKFLEDILQAGSAIREFMDGRTLDDYHSDRMFRSAMQHEFMIIGEALSQISKINPKLAGAFADKRAVIAFRNILVHNYWRVDSDLVWSVAENYLEPFLERVEALLAELE